MGIFDGFMKKKGISVGAPMKGRYVSIKEVSDPTFSEEILGKGIAVLPAEGRVYAPADGTVTTVFPTGHAVAITTADEVEMLIHVGLDTVKLDGRFFEIRTAEGNQVKKGDLLVEVDLEQVKAAGYDIITPVLICNPDAFAEITCLTGQDAEPGDEIFQIKK